MIDKILKINTTTKACLNEETDLHAWESKFAQHILLERNLFIQSACGTRFTDHRVIQPIAVYILGSDADCLLCTYSDFLEHGLSCTKGPNRDWPYEPCKAPSCVKSGYSLHFYHARVCRLPTHQIKHDLNF